MRSVLHGVDGTTIAPEDKLSSEMVKEVLPTAQIVDEQGHHRHLIQGKGKEMQAATYHDAPCWFTPSMALVLLILLIAVIIYFCRKRTKGNQKQDCPKHQDKKSKQKERVNIKK